MQMHVAIVIQRDSVRWYCQSQQLFTEDKNLNFK